MKERKRKRRGREGEKIRNESGKYNFNCHP